MPKLPAAADPAAVPAPAAAARARSGVARGRRSRRAPRPARPSSTGSTSAPRCRAPRAGLMFRKVPRGTNWFYTLGSATMFAFLNQAITGVFLAMYYRPDAAGGAYESVRYITNSVFLGQFVRGMHKWGSTVMVILVFLHMGRTFFFGAYKYPRELNWVIGVVLLILTMLMSFTGYLLPFDQRSYWATIVGVNINGTGPFLGPYLSDFLRGGPEFNATTLSRFYAIHMLLVPGADHRDDRRAPLPGRQARHDRAAVAEAEGRARAGRGIGCEPAREGGLPPRVLADEGRGQAVLPLRGREGQPDGRASWSRVIITLSIVLGAELGPKANAATTHLRSAPRVVLLLPLRAAARDQAAGLHRPGDDRRADARHDPAVPAAVLRPRRRSATRCAGRSRRRPGSS